MPRGVPRAGTVVADKYVVEKLIGVGGMGAVVSATRSWDGTRVAIKVMLAEEAQHDDSTRRFFREARAAGVIDSPHVAKLLDFGRLADGVPFMVLELLNGYALDRTIRERAPMPIADAVDLVLQACQGVAEAHARGIVHRDIKPSNLFVTTGTDGAPLLKVLDFGISKATMKLEAGTDAPSLTETNATLGSPQYMSPEQLRSSKDVDSRTDIWSLGLILHKLLTGRPAFEADNVGAHFAMILADPPAPLRSQRPEAPAALEEVILTCLRKKREERWQDLGQLARALSPFGPPGAGVRADRVAAILEYAGVSSQSHPRISAGPEAPTTRDGSVRPRDIGEHTTSAWSPDTIARLTAPKRTLRLVAIAAATVVLLSVVAVGAHRLLGGSAAPQVAQATEPDRAREKQQLLARLGEGVASADERRKLEALCVLEGDEACLKAVAAAAAPTTPPTVAAAEPSVSASGPASQASAEASSKSRGQRGAAPAPSAGPAPMPGPTPSQKITPKGPMVETL
jgi:serine/threonine-protein kinase